MDWDFWTDPFLVDDDSYYWQQYLHFGRQRNFIENDALNVASCIQVLRISISDADTEIEGLEKDLLFLQNELACAENEKWHEICCSALTERINLVDVAISTLKNDHVDDTEVQLLLHNKPAETLHEIVQALQRDHCQDTNGQQLDVNILNPIVNDTDHALDKDCSNVDSNIILKEEGKELYGTSENSKSSELLLELHEKRSNDAENVEESLAKSPVASPNLGAICCVPDHSDDLKLSGTLDNKVTENEEVRSQLITTYTCRMVNLISSMGNGNIPREVKKENAIDKENDVSSDDFRFATGVEGREICLYSSLGASQHQNSGNSDLDKKLRDFAKESKVATAEDLEEDSMRLPLQVVYPQELCPVDTELCSFKGSEGDDSRQMMRIENTSHIDAENSAPISVLKMQTKIPLHTGLQLTDQGKQQAQGLKFKSAANLSKANMSMSFPSMLTAMGKRKAELEAFYSREPLDSPTEVNPNTSIVVSNKRQQKSKISTSLASLNLSMNRKITKRAVQPRLEQTVGRAIVPYDSELDAFYSRELLDSPTEVNPNTSIVVSNKRQQKSKISTSPASLNLSMNRKITKRAVQPRLEETVGRAVVPYDSELDAFYSRELLDSPTEVNPNTSIVVSNKRQQKSKISTSPASLNLSMNRKITKRAVQPRLEETVGRAIVPYDSEFSEFQKKTSVSKWPITAETRNSTVNLGVPNADKVSVIKGSQVDLDACKLPSLEGSRNNLNRLTLINLRALAKQHNLKKYSKLPKAALIELLIERLYNS